MTTKVTIVEQVKGRLKGIPSVSSMPRDGQIMQFASQVLATVLKTEFLTVHLPSGETIPAGSCLAVYEDLPVEPYLDRSRVKLPAIPVKLHMNMGVFHIGDNLCPDSQWIPLSPGQGAQIKTQDFISDLLEQTWYDIEGGYAVANTDVSKLKDGSQNKVRMKLVVMEVSHYGDFDILPITPEMAHQVIVETVNFFMGTPAPDKVNDSTAEPSKAIAQ